MDNDAITNYPPAFAKRSLWCWLGLHRWIYIDYVRCGMRLCVQCFKTK